jgi:hypothetical protein
MTMARSAIRSSNLRAITEPRRQSTGIETLNDSVRRRVAECTDSAPKALRASVWPIYTSVDATRPELIGSLRPHLYKSEVSSQTNFSLFEPSSATTLPSTYTT